MGQIITKLTGNEINETEFIDFESNYLILFKLFKILFN